jgi:hypothetical protein
LYGEEFSSLRSREVAYGVACLDYNACLVKREIMLLKHKLNDWILFEGIKMSLAV